jgi:hypothetical protein
MSSAKKFLGKNVAKRQAKLQKKKEKYSEFAQKNLEDIQKLLKERCPLDYKVINASIEAFLKNAISVEALKLELPPLSPPILSSLLYNMALWIGNTHAKES